MTITLAIIGHRDLRPGDLPAVQSSLRDWWSSQVARFKGNRPTLMTSLAPGADQLAAWILTGTTVALPARLRPVFPYAEAAYSVEVRNQEKTYNPPDCPWSFDILAHGSGIGTVERLNPDWPDGTSDQTAEGCYRAAGRYLAENADILIALWDGVYIGKIGGTSDTVLHALSLECQEARAEARRPPLEVHWLVVPRQSNPHPAGETFTWQPVSVPSSVARPALGMSKRFRKIQVTLPLALAILSVGCSAAGYWLNLTPEQLVDARVPADKVLVAIGHLTLNSLDFDSPGPGAPWIRIGRWLAVGFVLTTIASVMNGLFRWVDHLALRRVQRREHDLVCGLGWRGRGFIADSAQDKIRTIAVECLPDEAIRAACAHMRVPLVEGDATDPETMRKVGVQGVRCAFVVCNEDETNMQVVHQLARMTQSVRLWCDHCGAVTNHTTRQHAKRMVCCVGLHSQRSFQVLQNALPRGHRLDLRIFNPELVTARMLLQAHPIDRFAASPDASGAEVILLGDSAMANALAQQVLQQGIFEDGKELTLAWLTSDAAATCQSFISQYPVYQAATSPLPGQPWLARPPKVWFDEKVLPEIRFLDLPHSERSLIELFEGQLLPATGSWVTSVVVAIDDPAASASISYALAPRLEEIRRRDSCDITLACYYNAPEDIYRGDIEHALNRDFQSLPVRVFSDFMGDCSKAVVLGEELDRVARRVNGIYSPPKEQDAGKCCDKYCDEIWPDVTENDKDSNRQAGAHAWVKHRIRGRLRAHGFDAAAIERALAGIEHRRWCAEYLLKGFRPLTRIPSEIQPFSPTAEERALIARWFRGGKSAFKRSRRHLDLIPFGDIARLLPPRLAKREVAKDINQMRSLDRLLE